MQVVGLIGYVDKYDLVMNLAKTISIMGKSVLVIDATLDRKLKYIVPALNNIGRAYVTQYNSIDFAVGFDSIRDVEEYMSEQNIDISLYDFVLIDIDSARSYELFKSRGFDKKYFFINTSVLSVAKNRDIIRAMKVYSALYASISKDSLYCDEENSKLEMTKILYRTYMSRAANDYFEHKIREYDINWKEPEYEIPLEEQDKLVDIDSQFSGIIDLRKHTKLYLANISDLTAELIGDVNSKNVMSQIKRRKN